jgi:hypothetical protein
MPFTPASPFPKSMGDTVRSKDWNDAVNEIIRLDTAKVSKAGDTMTGMLKIETKGFGVLVSASSDTPDAKHGLYVSASGANGDKFGVLSMADGKAGEKVGIWGIAGSDLAGSSGTRYGVVGTSEGSAAGEKYGVYGSASSDTPDAKYGLHGSAAGANGNKYGVRGFADGKGGNKYGIYGNAGSDLAASTGTRYGVVGTSGGSAAGEKYGVYGSASSDTADAKYGVRGFADGKDGNKYGIYGNAGSDLAASTGTRYGVVGKSEGSAAGEKYGVFGSAVSGTPDAKYGLYGRALGSNGKKYGVYGSASGDSGENYGVYGYAPIRLGISYAGWFEGNVYITGALFKGGGGFLIDHPLDPKNKTLRHNFVESPENLCLYRGKVTLNSAGKATVKMPDYFAALTKEDEASVNITAIGEKSFLTSYEWNKPHTAFTIWGEPNAAVSYLVLADRDDPFIKISSRPVEEAKGGGHFEKGSYVMPEAYLSAQEIAKLASSRKGIQPEIEIPPEMEPDLPQMTEPEFIKPKLPKGSGL